MQGASASATMMVNMFYRNNSISHGKGFQYIQAHYEYSLHQNYSLVQAFEQNGFSFKTEMEPVKSIIYIYLPPYFLYMQS